MTGNQRQLDLAGEFVRRVRREVCPEERARGYEIRKLGGPQIGFVRHNVRGDNAGCFVVYAYGSFDDPENRFKNCSKANPPNPRGWHTFVDPSDCAAVEYAVRALESSWDCA